MRYRSGHASANERREQRTDGILIGCGLLRVNPAAGANRKRDLEGLIHGALAGSALRYEVRLTAGAGHAEAIARDAAREGFRIVAAVGGDGTVNEAGRGLMGTPAALG